jgi:D-alanyl-D-alanine carboxypeptidase
LDAALSRFVDAIPNGERITVEELLNMKAGVYSYTEDETFLRDYERNPLMAFTPQDALKIIGRHDPAFAPGAKAQYSDSNYILLGLIVEKVKGRPLEQVIQSEILDPLGMRHEFRDRTGLAGPFCPTATTPAQAARCAR